MNILNIFSPSNTHRPILQPRIVKIGAFVKSGRHIDNAWASDNIGSKKQTWKGSETDITSKEGMFNENTFEVYIVPIWLKCDIIYTI